MTMENIIKIDEILGRQFNGERLSYARKYRGLSVTELADKVGVQRQTVSMYENNKLTNPEYDKIKKFSEILNFPTRFFMEKSNVEFEKSATYFRSLMTTNKIYKAEQEVKIEFISIIYEFLSEYLDFQPLNLPDIDIGTSPEEAAAILREHWNLGNRPIDNLIYLAESNGLIVAGFNSNSNAVDAFSHKISSDLTDTYLIGYSKNKSSATRIHFDIAHELGHILLHNWKEDLECLDKTEFDYMEKQAHKFAAAFLLPADTFIPDVLGYEGQLSHYIELKKKWKVSIAAMIIRAKDLGLISPEVYQKMMRNMQKLGIRKVEPLDDILTTAKPSLLKQAVVALFEDGAFTPKEFIDELSSAYGLTLNPELIEELLNLPAGMMQVKNDLKVSIQLKDRR